MTVSMNPLFLNEVVDCMAEGKHPTADELLIVAERIWSDGGAERSAFAWGKLGVTEPERVRAMRSAELALCGTSDPLTSS